MPPYHIGDDDALLATLQRKLGIKTRESMQELSRQVHDQMSGRAPTRTRLEPLRSGSQPTSEPEPVDPLEQHLRRTVGQWL